MTTSPTNKKSRSPKSVLASLSTRIGKLTRVGGNSRVYKVGSKTGACYLIDDTSRAIGLILGANGVETICMWRIFSAQREPDYAIDIPQDGEFEGFADQVVALLRKPRVGAIEVPAENINEDLSVSLPVEFARMAHAAKGDQINNLTLADLQTIASENGVSVPQQILRNKEYSIGGSKFDLTPLLKPKTTPISKIPDTDRKAFDDLVNLAKATGVRKLASEGKVVLYGKTADGLLFEIPGLEEYSAALERMYTSQAKNSAQGEGQSMEEQYQLAQERAIAIATGKTNFVKSLLIVGAPSAGKTYNVMEAIKKAGLKEGTDYIVKKGRTTDGAMFRTLIEQINGLVIFDDCDSVMETTNGTNMLKGALDTDPVRQVSNDTLTGLNTAAMKPEDRHEIVMAMSRVFRNVPTAADIELFRPYLKKKKTGNKDEPVSPPKPRRTFRSVAAERGEDISDQAKHWNIDAPIDDEEDAAPVADIDREELTAIQQYLERRLPNKIDYSGRIIFISNLKKEDWNSAILTRAFYVNMEFNSGEMLDFIDKIKGNFKAAGMTEGDKQEVIDWIRELYVTGKFKTDINFRIVQQAFDLFITSPTRWKQMVSVM